MKDEKLLVTFEIEIIKILHHRGAFGSESGAKYMWKSKSAKPTILGTLDEKMNAVVNVFRKQNARTTEGILLQKNIFFCLFI